uniref:Phosphatidylinositol kinase putative n=1 Tax=Albugo laibachii Nc14 TaxID=890382 RepID=F0WVT7_9STRA|nr:phosphatidylinositol kinase putative [Albugo laibachii Nc14]|eukprot:CCA25537.1 phosphatidylinositol kinase putative [Albugo laibachii Nc14]
MEKAISLKQRHVSASTRRQGERVEVLPETCDRFLRVEANFNWNSEILDTYSSSELKQFQKSESRQSRRSFTLPLHKNSKVMENQREGNSGTKVAKVRCIKVDARLLRPTRASIAGRRNRFTGTEKARKMQTRSTKKIETKTSHRKLTIPKSPNFHYHPQNAVKKSHLSMTSKELLEIRALWKRVDKQKKKNQRYHQSIVSFVQIPASANATDKERFVQTIRSSGSIGIPTVRRPKLTVPIGFDLQIDKRFAHRQKKASLVCERIEEEIKTKPKQIAGETEISNEAENKVRLSNQNLDHFDQKEATSQKNDTKRSDIPMATLKISWREKNDMRRVKVYAVNKTLNDYDSRDIKDWNSLKLDNLKEYICHVSQNIGISPSALQIYYLDDEEEKICVTNDQELEEGLRLSREIAVFNGRQESDSICRIIVEIRNREEKITSNEREAHLEKSRILALLTEMNNLLVTWKAGPEFYQLESDLASILNEEGTQQALLQIFMDPELSTYLSHFLTQVKNGQNIITEMRNAENHRPLDSLASIVITKCPQALARVTRLTDYLKYGPSNSCAYLSSSDFFENVTKKGAEEKEACFAIFQDDVTCPDGTVLPPKYPFDKIWKIRNPGPTRWPQGVRLLCVGGDRLQAPDNVLVPHIAPGNSIEICIRMIAPDQVGRYTGYWRLSTQENVRFGQRIWVDINVIDSNMSLSNCASLTPKLFYPRVTPKQFDDTSVNVVSDIKAETRAEKVKWKTEQCALCEMGFIDSTLGATDGDNFYAYIIYLNSQLFENKSNKSAKKLGACEGIQQLTLHKVPKASLCLLLLQKVHPQSVKMAIFQRKMSSAQGRPECPSHNTLVLDSSAGQPVELHSLSMQRNRCITNHSLFSLRFTKKPVLLLRTSIQWRVPSLRYSDTKVVHPSPSIVISPFKLDLHPVESVPEASEIDVFETNLTSQVAKIEQVGMEMTSEGCGGVYFVYDKNQREPNKWLAVFKPRDEEYMAAHNPRGYVQEDSIVGKSRHPIQKGLFIGEGAIRERAAYLLDAAYGNFSGVPVTEITKLKLDGHLKEGSLQQFVSSSSSAEDMGTLRFSVSEVHKIGILDLRLFNTDRHAGNVLLSTNASEMNTFLMTPIDHGMCLPSFEHLDGACFDWMSWPQSRLPFLPAEKEHIASIDTQKDASILRNLRIREECITTMRLSTFVLQQCATLDLSLFDIAKIVHRSGNRTEPCLLETLVSAYMKDYTEEDTSSRDFCDTLVEKVTQKLAQTLAEVPKKRKPRSLFIKNLRVNDKGCPVKTAEHVRDVFSRLGFNDRETVALIGAHAVGRAHPELSGFSGPWTKTERTFSNQYFKNLLQVEWKPTEGKSPTQFDNPSKTLMMLPSDMVLIQDKEFRPFVELYAQDQDLFFKDFAAAFQKVTENGVSFEN